MDEIIKMIQATIDKKGIQKNCRRLLKKYNPQSVKDTGYLVELAIWLYIYGALKEALLVCNLVKDEKFTGNYTLWDNIDHILCLKARILKELGSLEESQKIIRFINQYRHPELYQNGVDWFIHTLDLNIQNSLEIHSKASANGWRLLKLEKAIAYKEAGGYPLKDEQLEVIIQNLKTILAKEK